MTRFTVAVVTGILLTFSQAGIAQEEGSYQIKNRNSGKLLAVAAAKTIQDDAKKGNPQEWKLVKAGEFFKIVHVKSGKLLAAPPNASKEGAGTQAVIGNDTGGKNQEWKLVERKVKGVPHYLIKSRTEDMVLDVDNASNDNGARVILWPLNPKGERANQLWSLAPGK